MRRCLSGIAKQQWRGVDEKVISHEELQINNDQLPMTNDK
jgi:hypothetical protein